MNIPELRLAGIKFTHFRSYVNVSSLFCIQINRFKLSLADNLDVPRLKNKNGLIQQSMPLNKNGNWRSKIDKYWNESDIPEIEIYWSNLVG